jgi:formate/nitrite transporter
MNSSFSDPKIIAESFVETGVQKAGRPALKQFMLGVLAGAYIAFAAEGSAAATHTMGSVGLAKTLAGALFATGLMLVVVAGAELFTGNCLLVVAWQEKRVTTAGMLKNWCLVYSGNFVGALTLAVLIFCSGQQGFSDGLLGVTTIKTAVYKVGLSFEKALILGILCNWLVCLAVWMAAAAKDITGKLLAVFFPIWLFVASGFEHCVANMYYIPAGILAKGDVILMQQALAAGVSTDQLASLGWGSFLLNNLLPVTLGNIIGGALPVGIFYRFIYVKKQSGEKKADM